MSSRQKLELPVRVVSAPRFLERGVLVRERVGPDPDLVEQARDPHRARCSPSCSPGEETAPRDDLVHGRALLVVHSTSSRVCFGAGKTIEAQASSQSASGSTRRNLVTRRSSARGSRTSDSCRTVSTSCAVGDQPVVEARQPANEVGCPGDRPLRRPALRDQGLAGDAVERVAGDVDQPDRRAHHAAEPGQLARVAAETQAGLLAGLRADHAQLPHLALPSVRNRVRVPGRAPPGRARRVGLRAPEQRVEERAPVEALRDDQPERVDLVRDRDVRVRVEQRPDQAVARARVADEEAEGAQLSEADRAAAAAVDPARPGAVQARELGLRPLVAELPGLGDPFQREDAYLRLLERQAELLDLRLLCHEWIFHDGRRPRLARRASRLVHLRRRRPSSASAFW